MDANPSVLDSKAQGWKPSTFYFIFVIVIIIFTSTF